MSIYGDIKTNYLKECNESINPDNYGVSKLEAETTLDQLMNKNKSIADCFNKITRGSRTWIT